MSQKEHGEVRSTSGTLKGTYHYLDSPSPHLFPFVFISNVTDSLQMFRVCKNGKPIAFPLLLPNQYKIVYINFIVRDRTCAIGLFLSQSMPTKHQACTN